MAEETTIASYDFEEDAAGLGDFILGTMRDLPDREFVVMVRDGDFNFAKTARFVRETAPDGSTEVTLYIEFDKMGF